MFLQIILLAAMVYAAYRLRPDPQTFPKHYESLQRSHGTVVAGMFSRLLGGLPGGSHFTYTDLIIATLAQVEETGEMFVGVLGIWLLLPTNQRAGSGESAETIEMGRLAARSEALVREAHQLKATGEHEKAALAYERAAAASDKSGDAFAGAELLDEAARCWRTSGKDSKYFEMTGKAVGAFEKRSRHGKAAGLLDKAAKHCLTLADNKDATTSVHPLLQQAAAYYQRAAGLYEVEGDSRSENLKLDRLHVLARLGLREEAATGFAEAALQIAQRDPVLINQSQRLLLMAALCSVEDVQLYSRRVGEWTQKYSWLANSREGKLALLLGEALGSGNVDKGMQSRLQREKGMIASLPLWAEQLWSQTLSRLDEGLDDIR